MHIGFKRMIPAHKCQAKDKKGQPVSRKGQPVWTKTHLNTLAQKVLLRRNGPFLSTHCRTIQMQDPESPRMLWVAPYKVPCKALQQGKAMLFGVIQPSEADTPHLLDLQERDLLTPSVVAQLLDLQECDKCSCPAICTSALFTSK